MKLSSATPSHLVSADHNCLGESLPPAIDTDLLASRCLGDVPFVFTLLGELESSGLKYVEAITRHAAAADMAEAADAAHALKGAAGIIGAEPLRLLAAEIEGCGMSQDRTRMAALIEDLQTELQRCLAYICVLRQRRQHEGAKSVFSE